MPEQELTSIAEHLARTLDVWECDLYEWDAERGALTPTAFWARESTQADYDWLGTVYTLEENHAVKAIVEGSDAYEEQLDDPGMSAADRALMEKWGEKSALTMPLVYQDEIVGCLTLVEKRAARRFTDDEKHLLRQLAVPAAAVMHNLQDLSCGGGAYPPPCLAARLHPRRDGDGRRGGRAGPGLPEGRRGPGRAELRHLGVRV